MEFKGELPITTAHRPRRQWFYLLTAALTCPCHLPIYLAILAGTSLGAVLRENVGLALLGFTAVFVLVLALGLRRPGAGSMRAKDGRPSSVSSAGDGDPG